MDGLFSEMNRCREVLKLYDEIPEGKFGGAMIRQRDMANKIVRERGLHTYDANLEYHRLHKLREAYQSLKNKQ